jgi:hypothetical protein
MCNLFVADKWLNVAIHILRQFPDPHLQFFRSETVTASEVSIPFTSVLLTLTIMP